MTIRQASGTGRRDALKTTGWVNMPYSQTPDHDLSDACLQALDVTF
jgi:hypothetical protein